MSTKLSSGAPVISGKGTTRRQLLEGMGALAATTACGSTGGATIQGRGGAGGAGGSASGGSVGAMTTGGGGGGADATRGGVAGGGGEPSVAGAGGANGGVGGAGGSSGAGGSGGGALVPPTFDDVPTCVASKTDGLGQGPFFIHELEKGDDVSLVRQDIRGQYHPAAPPGIEMQLHLRVLDATSTECSDVPLADVDVYIWHTDAQGYYSGFGTRGANNEQDPDQPYSGTPGSNNLESTDRFCRGMQTSDADGVVSFRSIFPGWYNGRALHIHFMAFKRGSTSVGRAGYGDANSGGSWLFTTQFYFDPIFSKSVHESNQPYLLRTTLSGYANAMAASENGNSGLRAKASLGKGAFDAELVVAQMQILLDPKA